MKIVIDSTNYKQERSFNKKDFTLLKDLGRNNIFEIHIPWIVYQECLTSNIQELETDFSHAINKLTSLDRKGIHPHDHSKIINIVSKLNDLKINLKESTSRLWNDFISESNAKLHDFNASHSKTVFENYFSGDKPFKNLKSREDIPDAFIYLMIKDLAKSEKIILISNDNNLVNQFDDNKNILIHKSLKDFYNSDEYKPFGKLYENSLIKGKFKEAVKFIIENKDIIEEEVKHFANSLSHYEFEDPNLMSENNEGSIVGFTVNSVKILKSQIKQIADQVFVPVQVIGFALIDYFVFKSDYWIYENRPQIADDWNDHYYRVEDEVNMILTSVINFDIEQLLKIKNDKEVIELQINSFESIEIKK